MTKKLSGLSKPLLALILSALLGTLLGSFVTPSRPAVAQDVGTIQGVIQGDFGGNCQAVAPVTSGQAWIYNGTTKRWTNGTGGGAPTGAAGGSLTGTYPNPGIAASAVTEQIAYNGAPGVTQTAALGGQSFTSPVNAFVANTLTLTQSNTTETALLVTSQGTGISCPGSGTNSERFGASATALGVRASAFGQGSHADSADATACGRVSAAGGASSTVIGAGSTDTNFTSTTIVGQGSSATNGNNCTIVGAGSTSGVANATVIGRGLTATAANQTMLGGNVLVMSTADAGISEISSSVWAFGNGATANKSGQVQTALVAVGIHASVSSYTAIDQTATFWPVTGTTTVMLPNATGLTGVMYTIKNNGVGTVTVSCTGAQTIDGSATKTLTVQYQGLQVISDGTNWEIQ